MSWTVRLIFLIVLSHSVLVYSSVYTIDSLFISFGTKFSKSVNNKKIDRKNVDYQDVLKLKNQKASPLIDFGFNKNININAKHFYTYLTGISISLNKDLPNGVIYPLGENFDECNPHFKINLNNHGVFLNNQVTSVNFSQFKINSFFYIDPGFNF